MNFKGSKTAMAKVVASSDFINIINGLLKKKEVSITTADVSMPDRQNPYKEVTLSTFLTKNFDSKKAKDITSWWIKTGNATPKWDLIATCIINGERGILLVEAKAHKGELKKDKKQLKKEATTNSKENHEQIAVAIGKANTHITNEIGDIALSRDTCYQFSNRVAHSW